jgi:hypothetical protein
MNKEVKFVSQSFILRLVILLLTIRQLQSLDLDTPTSEDEIKSTFRYFRSEKPGYYPHLAKMLLFYQPVIELNSLGPYSSAFHTLEGKVERVAMGKLQNTKARPVSQLVTDIIVTVFLICGSETSHANKCLLRSLNVCTKQTN